MTFSAGAHLGRDRILDLLGAGRMGMVYYTRDDRLERDVVQVKSARTGHDVEIDRDEGRIIDHRKGFGPYKNLPVARVSPRDT